MKEVVTELLSLLDRDLEALEERTSSLRDLAEALSRNDLKRLEAIAQALHESQTDCLQRNERRSTLRRRVAGLLGASPRRVNLSLISRHVDEDERLALDRRRHSIALAADELAGARISASIILHERARLNRAMLAALFPHDDAAPVYSPAGRPKSPVGPRILDLET